MVLPIGGFLPIPLALMIPFMFMQSVMMGYGFGTGFQYSKRKISAMSNEEFNATTIANETQKMFASYKLIIPDLEQSIRDSKDLQKTVLTEMINIPANLLKDLFGVLAPETQEPSGESVATTGTFETTQETTAGPGTTTETTRTADPYAVENALAENVGDPRKGLVYRDIWVDKDSSDGQNPWIGVDSSPRVKQWFYASYPEPRYLVVKSIVWLNKENIIGAKYYRQFRVYFYLSQ